MLRAPRRGDRIPGGVANQVLRALQALRVQTVWPIVYDESANVIYLDGQPDDIDYIRITGAGSGPSYPWTEVFPDPAGGGGFIDGKATGTPTGDPARELNGNAALWHGTAFVVECWRDSQKFLWFRASACPPPTP